MRVLVITNMYPPHHYGGYELNCQEFVTALRAAGHHALVLTSDVVVPGVPEETEPRSDVRRDLRLYWHDHVVLRPSLGECLSIERTNQRALEHAIDDLAPDVVSVWHMGCLSLGLLSACRARGLPMVFVVNDDWLVYGPLVDRWTKLWRRAGPLAALGERLLHVPCRLADLGEIGACCFISSTTKNSAEQDGHWRFRQATVSYCGINIDDFPLGARPMRPRWSWRLLVVGRIDERKGIDTAIRALAQLPRDATLDVVGRGDGAHLAALHALARELGVDDRVTFAVADRAELADRYATADALIFPPRWAEPFGLVPLEAMACSTPVVATGTGGSSEFLIDETNCLTFAVDDPAALAAALRRLAGDTALRTRLVAAGRVTAAELTLPRWLALLLGWHAAAATGTAPPDDRAPIRAVLDGWLATPPGAARGLA